MVCFGAQEITACTDSTDCPQFEKCSSSQCKDCHSSNSDLKYYKYYFRATLAERYYGTSKPHTDSKCLYCAHHFWGPFLNFDHNGDQRYFCYSCPDHSSSTSGANANALDCACNAGYTADNNKVWVTSSKDTRDTFDTRQCKSCEEGKYKNTIGTEGCSVCPEGLIPNTAKTMCICADPNKIVDTRGQCQPCQANAHAVDNECVCDEGYYISDEACIKCQVLNAVDCFCDKGYFLNSSLDECAACSFGKYKAETGNQNCTQCQYPRHNQQSALTSCSNCTAIEDFCTGRFKLFTVSESTNTTLLAQSGIMQGCSHNAIFNWSVVKPASATPAQLCVH